MIYYDRIKECRSILSWLYWKWGLIFESADWGIRLFGITISNRPQIR
jgi:hypothetical protein